MVIEIAVLVLFAFLFAGMTAFAIMGINSWTSALLSAGYLSVCLAAVATIEVARQVRGGTAILRSDLWLYAFIAISGAVIATGLTVYGVVFLSPMAMWARRLTPMGYGCLLWIPIVHLSVQIRADVATDRRLRSIPPNDMH